VNRAEKAPEQAERRIWDLGCPRTRSFQKEIPKATRDLAGMAERVFQGGLRKMASRVTEI